MNLKDPNYEPNGFVMWMMREVFRVKSAADLARRLDMNPDVISKVRTRRLPIPAHVIIAIHEETGMRTLDIKARMFRQQVAA